MLKLFYFEAKKKGIELNKTKQQAAHSVVLFIHFRIG